MFISFRCLRKCVISLVLLTGQHASPSSSPQAQNRLASALFPQPSNLDAAVRYNSKWCLRWLLGDVQRPLCFNFNNNTALSRRFRVSALICWRLHVKVQPVVRHIGSRASLPVGISIISTLSVLNHCSLFSSPPLALSLAPSNTCPPTLQHKHM